MDTTQLLEKANAVLLRVQGSDADVSAPVGSRNIPLKTAKSYKELRSNAINVFGRLLSKDREFFDLTRSWLIEGGVTDQYMIDAIMKPENPNVPARQHRGSWAGFIHMASDWSSTFPALVDVARSYEQFKLDHPSLVLIGGTFTPIMAKVVTKDILAMNEKNVKWPTFLITSPGGQVSVLSEIDDAYLSHGFHGRTCWCIDMAASCGAFFLALGDHVDLWTDTFMAEGVFMGKYGSGTSDADAVVMFHQVRGMLGGMVSLHDMELIARTFRISQTAVDARCITPNFETGFSRAGNGDLQLGYRRWVRGVVPKLLHRPIFKSQGMDPQNPGTAWTEDRLVDHYMQFDPYSATPCPGGIMEVCNCCCMCIMIGLYAGHIFCPRRVRRSSDERIRAKTVYALSNRTYINR